MCSLLFGSLMGYNGILAKLLKWSLQLTISIEWDYLFIKLPAWPIIQLTLPTASVETFLLRLFHLSMIWPVTMLAIKRIFAVYYKQSTTLSK